MLSYFIESIDKLSLERYMKSVTMAMNKDAFIRINKIYPDLLSSRDIDPDAILLVKYIFMGIFNEDISYNVFNTITPGSESDVSDGLWDDLYSETSAKYKYTELLNDLWKEYGKYGYRLKEKKLRELYNIRVYHGIKNKVSYRDAANITSEIDRILTSSEKSFLNLITSDISSELLNINETEAKMLSTERVVLYSALINFDTINQDLLNKILNISGTSNISSVLTSSTWRSYSKMFKEILNKLDIQLIHY